MIKRYSNLKNKRKARIRAKIIGSSQRPRLTVFRSLKHIYAQIIDDSQGKTLVAASDTQTQSSSKSKKLTKTQQAQQVGQLIAQKAQKKKITQVAFDRGPYKFHGRVKALADAARSAGLEF